MKALLNHVRTLLAGLDPVIVNGTALNDNDTSYRRALRDALQDLALPKS